MALNFRIWMNSVKNHDRSLVIFAETEAFQIARQSTLIEALPLARKAMPGGGRTHVVSLWRSDRRLIAFDYGRRRHRLPAMTVQGAWPIVWIDIYWASGGRSSYERMKNSKMGSARIVRSATRTGKGEPDAGR